MAKTPTAASLILALALVTCEKTDLGSECKLFLGQKEIRVDCADPDTCVKMRPGLDYVALGAGECEDFTCIASPRTGLDGTPTGGEGYCSRPCAREGESCGADGFTCRTLILDQEFIDDMRAKLSGRDADSDGQDDFQQYFGGVSGARYCARTPCTANSQCPAGQTCKVNVGHCVGGS